MNNEQLEQCLRNLKSSPCELSDLDHQVTNHIENRIQKEFTMQKISRRRNHRIIMAMAIFIFLGTGFVAAGGDATIVNYFTQPTQTDDDGQPVYQYEPLLSKVIRHVHAHFGHHVKNEH